MAKEGEISYKGNKPFGWNTSTATICITWEKLDGEVIKVTNFCFNESFFYGVPILKLLLFCLNSLLKML